MSKLITSTGWYGIPGKDNRRAKVHMVADGRPVCSARPTGQYQWCSHGANYQYTDCELCRRYYDKYEANRAKPVPDPIIITHIGGCARCGGYHRALQFEELKHPHGKYTHWAKCPTNKQPILMQIV